MRIVFQEFLRLRRLPVAARYAITTTLVLALFAVCQLFGETLRQDSLVVFFPAVILAAMLFDHGNGFYAVALSAGLTVYFFLEPFRQFAVARPGDLVALVVFIVSGGVTAALIETLHRTISDLSAAHAELHGTHDQLTRAHREVQASERQKDLMLEELAHRTKNDLSLVSSLLQMQARVLGESTARDALTVAVERIRVLGKAHARLTRSADMVVVDTRAFLGELCDDLRAVFIGTRPVALLCEADSFVLSHRRAVAIGLITHELVTNAMKYAFPHDRDGTVRVAFERRGGDYRLAIEDDGVGLQQAPRAAEASSSGLGQRLVRTLTLQLEGRFECVPRAPGTVCTVTFPAMHRDG